MSNIYITEPQTRGKVLLKTTAGDIDVELWSKECPKACRNFIQLCMEGYYDNTIFHRVAKGKFIQGGDPTGTGEGGESIYGGPFADEFHSRIRFSHRGIVAMASTGPNTNKSQFFITLDKTEWLQRQHTIFGKVTGDTVYNVLSIGEIETDENDRPQYPPKILSVDILNNPFDDIEPRSKQTEAPKQEAPKQKAKKNLTLLSFGNEEEEEVFIPKTKKKIMSAHDALNDPTLLKEAAVDTTQMTDKHNAAKDVIASEEQKREALLAKIHNATKHKSAPKPTSDDEKSSDGEAVRDDQDFDMAMRRRIIAKKRKAEEESRQPVAEKAKATSDDDDSDDDPEAAKRAQDEEYKRLKREVLGYSKKKETAAVKEAKPVSALAQRREKYLAKKMEAKQRSASEVLDKLTAFQKSLSESKKKVSTDGGSPPPKPATEEGQAGESDEEIGEDWKVHKLQFGRQVQDPVLLHAEQEQYAVVDPLARQLEGTKAYKKIQAIRKGNFQSMKRTEEDVRW